MDECLIKSERVKPPGLGLLTREVDDTTATTSSIVQGLTSASEVSPEMYVNLVLEIYVSILS